MKLSFSKKGRSPKRNTSYVLVVGDEGGILIYLRGVTVIRRLFVASPDAGNINAFNDLLNNDPKAPLSLLVDMMDQNYIRQTLPPVSRLSVGKIIKRRLDKDLGVDDIKGSILLGREKEGRKDWSYMMVSTPSTAVLKDWIEYTSERRNPFDGIYLLPLEMESFIAQLAKACAIESGSEWQLLVSHNKVGGFRQIILHKGKMVFTRMALPIGESVPDVIAGNIEQEIMSTVEYLKRMGYQDAAGLDVIVIASRDIKAAIDRKKIHARTVELLTPYDAGQRLQMEQAAQPEDHFGDVVIGTYFGSQKKHLLRLQTRYTQKLQDLRQVIFGTKVATALMTVVLLGMTASMGFDIMGLMDETEDWVKKKNLSQMDLDATHKKAAKLPGNIEKISDIVSLYKVFDIDTFKPLPFIKRVSSALHDTLLVEELDWKVIDPIGVTAASDPRKIDAELHLHLATAPNNLDDQKSQWKAALQSLEDDFKDFDVKHSGIPGEIGEDQVFQTNFGQSGGAPQDLDKDKLVIVQLSGPKDAKKAVKPPPPPPRSSPNAASKD